ncbi:serine/threonine-protein kinase Nek4 [Betta splendens]|uniref:Serine/threonine-protein kinase Nek4 n=1 Tax=Betta splendens TaxID=158456 RepID=A0A6P7MJH0_BETSP|nr:serine/threonine-protein kinase Nek4 [Betta splendens]
MMNNYIFIRVVGKGSYGEVNLVKNRTDRKQYVIKKLNLTTSSKRERRAAEQEAQLLSQLRHPNIVTYRESWEGDDCQLYIVMGFCEGGDLYHRLKQQKGELLPERQVVEWFVQIAMALQYLHDKNILHRDLKTQNIFLTQTNIIKVGDLGIARVLENQNDMASTLIGTPYYMSPELFSNKPYNHKSDVWALGCCVYEMSTLKHAFNAKDMNSLVYRIVEGKLPQMPSKYDPLLGDLIKSMLCKRPEDRPDVKVILRQPYIKKQIAMFLEATKEKTAKSRKKVVSGSGDGKATSSSSVVSRQEKPERHTSSPQSDPLVRVKRKDEKSQQHKVQNSGNTSVKASESPKASSPDALEGSCASLATVSNISIDIPPQKDEDLLKRQVQGPQLIVSLQQPGNEHVTHRIDKGERKPDLSSPPSPVKAPLKSVSGVASRGEEKRRASNGLVDNLPQAGPVFRDDQISVEARNDTMDLLKEAERQNPKLEEEKAATFCIPEKGSVHRSNAENNGSAVDITLRNKSDMPLRRALTHHPDTSDVQDLESTEDLLKPFPSVLEPVQEESAFPFNKPGLSTQLQFSLESSMSQQHKRKNERKTYQDRNKSKLVASRPLPPAPVENIAVEERKRNRRCNENEKAGEVTTSTSVSSCKDGLSQLAQDRPLSARERRRLRQSQDSASQPGFGAIRRASYDVTGTKAEHYDVSVTSVSDSDTISDTSNKRKKLLEQKSDEDECSSSTSSTEHSERDCGERKTESSDMQELVNMMTQTLRTDVGDYEKLEDKGLDSTAMPEFKLNRKYRDTLVLHGKAREETEKLSLSQIPIASTSGPAKIRRAIERLRTDVLKGLGVKLLDRVLEIMDEEDDDVQREVCLRNQMGNEKYQAYAVMVRQLKFFEDMAFKV